ncbi:MAG: twin-arginine translocase subunit TatC [Sciscionella sp.]
MTLVEHLYELRRRIGYAVIALILGAVVAFLWYSNTIGSFPTLGKLMIGPYCDLPAHLRLTFGGDNKSCALLQTHPFEGFTIRLKVSVAAGAVLSSPAWLYQLWAFITPALKSNEQRYAFTFVSCASVLFAFGAVLAYTVLPEALLVLTNVGGSQFVSALAGDNYFSFLINLLIIFGISFELPLLVVMLNLVGILKYDKLKGWRRGIVFALFCFAAVATPGGDPISMLVLAGALTVLFEFAIQIARLHDKRLAQKRIDEGWDTSNPDEATALHHVPAPVAVNDADPAQQPASGVNGSRYDDAT